MVLGPLGLMTWLGVRLVGAERSELRASFRRLHLAQLRDVEAVVQGVIARTEHHLDAQAAKMTDAPGTLRRAVRTLPAVQQVFLLGADGTLLHPDLEKALTRREEAFLVRAQQLWKDTGLFLRGGPEHARTPGPAAGWYSWFWGDGMHLVRWVRTSAGRVVGFELNRSRLVADVIAALPDSQLDPATGEDFGIVLLDAKGESLYQWGRHPRRSAAEPAAELSLGAPLGAWRLQLIASGTAAAEAFGSALVFNVVAGLVVVGLVLAGLAWYFYRESARELREARQRVSFVNQVSHELKTPLTNIRMYAELLQETLGEEEQYPDAPGAGRYLRVIVAESQRLGRLIHNVLTFGRQRRGAMRLRTTVDEVDRIVSEAVRGFAPSLENRGVQVRIEPGAPGRVRVDPDILGQILGNLLGNLEKYAPGSGEAVVTTARQGAVTTVTVEDRGPGIPAADRERVFRPFVRLSSRVTDGVAGTGIGLAIARDLARLHGGDLVLEPSGSGARFRLTLHTEPAQAGPEEESA